jgi:hypothetical protein
MNVLGPTALTILFGMAVLPALPPAWADEPQQSEDVKVDESPCSKDFCTPAPTFPWYVRTEGIAMRRQVEQTTPFAATVLATDVLQPVSPSNWTRTTVLSSDDLGQPYSAGPKLTIGHTLGESRFTVEVSYFQLSTFDTAASVSDPSNSIYSPFTGFGNEVTTAPGSPADTTYDARQSVTVSETSRLDSGELNVKWAVPMPEGCVTASVLVGARHVDVREHFDYNSQCGALNPVLVEARTGNNLWGGQIGGQIDVGCTSQLWISLEVKGALCGNTAYRELDATVNQVGYSHPRFSQGGSASIGDFSASLSWQPTSAITARVGYQALYFDGLVLAQKNFGVDSVSLVNAATQPPLNRNGNVLYQGPFAGLQLNW